MNNAMEKYLPIGTVVMLKGGAKRLMITGFCSVSKENNEVMYDYTGVLYPEGMLSSDQMGMFNHDQIAQIYYMGFVDEEEKAFKKQLKTLIDKADSLIPGGIRQQNTNQSIQNSETEIPPIGPGIPDFNSNNNTIS